ncbi:MAG: tetratricopeptide repeat protein [Alkalimonas sp.]|nr:tetratricopeptide repeat protein [Alkalimonas sp.]
MRMLFYWLCTALGFTCCPAFAANANTTPSLLSEAEDFLRVQPARTLALLDSITLASEAPEIRLHWHILNLRASVQTNQLDRTMHSLEQLFQDSSSPHFIAQLTTINSALGIWLRRHDYLVEAQDSYRCALKFATTDQQRITLLNSKALVARQLDEPEVSRQQLKQARELARQHDLLNVEAMVENNLGLLAMDATEHSLAEQKFRRALALYQSIDHRAGQISAGINLLFVFLVEGNTTGFERLYPPTERLTDHFTNHSKQALLRWLHSSYRQRQGELISAKEKEQLAEQFNELEDSKVKALVAYHLALPMSLALNASITPRSPFDRSWFQEVVACNWPAHQED